MISTTVLVDCMEKMMNDFLSNKQVDMLVEIAKEVQHGDPFDWGDVSIDEDEAYRLMAANVLEMPQDLLVLAGTITKLLVENMVLNYRLMDKK